MVDRISRDEMLMEMAEVISKRATCSRAQVGVVISRDGRIIATGYNGAPAGMPHCTHDCDCGSTDKYGDVILPHSANCSSIGGCEVVEHAERNAIAFSARYGTALDGSEVHCTHAPCHACAKSIVNAGIRKVTYKTSYRLTEGLELLTQAGVEVVQIA